MTIIIPKAIKATWLRNRGLKWDNFPTICFLFLLSKPGILGTLIWIYCSLIIVCFFIVFRSLLNEVRCVMALVRTKMVEINSYSAQHTSPSHAKVFHSRGRRGRWELRPLLYSSISAWSDRKPPTTRILQSGWKHHRLLFNAGHEWNSERRGLPVSINLPPFPRSQPHVSPFCFFFQTVNLSAYLRGV